MHLSSEWELHKVNHSDVLIAVLLGSDLQFAPDRSSKAKQGSVLLESTLANEISLEDPLKGAFSWSDSFPI